MYYIVDSIITIFETSACNILHNILFYYFSFINDLTYREAVENSVNYNTRLCIERRLRMPFLDTQTGITNLYGYLYIFVFVGICVPTLKL